ncbi:MAG: NAD(P)/FAD-dependent oxidoreductase [Chloroflexi bacterium]|nr:NAD(P)/FAD-dependent oxidoreductase [Chloroflexota bacterium]
MDIPAYDVIVVGAGPAGSAAAMRCARKGFKTLLLEKARTPRVKACTGMIMSRMAQGLIRQEFGDIPGEVLADSPYLKGYVIHVPGAGEETIESKAPFAWRDRLDHWMNAKVKEAGGEVWDGVRVDEVGQDATGCGLVLQTASGERELRARWLVGADGAASTVRKHLVPDLVVHYGEAVQEYHRCRLDMDKGWFHAFFPADYAPFYFSAYRKDGFAVVEIGSRKEQMGPFMQLARETLAGDFGFAAGSVARRRDGCVEPALLRQLLSGQFAPASGNALLAGDAAGLIMPVTGEGIGLAVQSGVWAAAAIEESAATGRTVIDCYQTKLSAIMETIRGFYHVARTLREKADSKRDYLFWVAQTWRRTLDVG